MVPFYRVSRCMLHMLSCPSMKSSTGIRKFSGMIKLQTSNFSSSKNKSHKTHIMILILFSIKRITGSQSKLLELRNRTNKKRQRLKSSHRFWTKYSTQLSLWPCSCVSLLFLQTCLPIYTSRPRRSECSDRLVSPSVASECCTSTRPWFWCLPVVSWVSW